MNQTFLHLTAFFVLVSAFGCNRPSAALPSADESVATGLVTMEIELDGEIVKVEFPDVSAGTTLESLMREMDDPAVEMSGSGTTAFVQSIGGKETSASEGWTFRVDDEFANEGVGNTVLNPPTTVSWKYGDFSGAGE